MKSVMDAQVRGLCRAVATALSTSSLTDEERQIKSIVYPDLPWTAPPLVTDLFFGGLPMQSYFESPIRTTADELIVFWKRTLDLMYMSPSRLLHRGTMATARGCLSYVRTGARSFRFSTPMGYPNVLAHDAGVIFSMEVAHAAYVSLPVREFIQSENDYYVTLIDDRKIGVQNGRPILPSQWSWDASGMVMGLAEMPRGITTTNCQYDQLAAVRSLAYEYQHKFKEYEGLDMALQALRYLTFGEGCPELITQQKIVEDSKIVLQEREKLLAEALDVMTADISDRCKLQAVEGYLVPDVMNLTNFRRQVFSSPHYPFTMEQGRRDKVVEVLSRLHKEIKTKLGKTK